MRTMSDRAGGSGQNRRKRQRWSQLSRLLTPLVVLAGMLGGLLVAAAPASAATTTLYVSPTGTSSGADTSCSAAAYSKIQSAVTAAGSGDTVVVCKGSYSSPSAGGGIALTKPVTLKASGSVTLSGAGPIFNLGSGTATGVTNVTIEGFDFKNITGSGYNGVITVGGYGAGDVTIADNTFSSSTDEAIGYHGNPGLTAPLGTNWNIVNNTITDVTGKNTQRSGIWLGNLSDSVIAGNSVSYTSWAGIIVTGTAQDNEKQNLIEDNTVSNIPEEGIQVAFGTGDTVSGNTVTYAGLGGAATGVSPSLTASSQVSGRNCALCLYNTNQSSIAVTGNTLAHSYEGVGVGQANIGTTNAATELGALGSGITVTGNNITADSSAGVADNAASGTLDATGNWWGAAGGPGATGATTAVIASSSSSTVTTTGYATSPITTATSSTVTATSSASTTNSSTPAATTLGSNLSAKASGGTGAVALSQYAGNPTTGLSTSGGESYFDVSLSSGNSFTGLTFKVCGVASGQTITWFNGSTWAPVSDQSPVSGGCSTVTVTSSTSPDLSQMGGTVFGVLDPVDWQVSNSQTGATAATYSWTFTTATSATLGKMTFTVPSGTALSSPTETVYGLSGTSYSVALSGTTVTLTITGGGTVPAGTNVAVVIDGFTNTTTAGTYTSTVSTFNTSGTAVDSGVSKNSVTFGSSGTKATVVVAKSLQFTNDTPSFTLAAFPDAGTVTHTVNLGVRTNATGYTLSACASSLKDTAGKTLPEASSLGASSLKNTFGVRSALSPSPNSRAALQGAFATAGNYVGLRSCSSAVNVSAATAATGNTPDALALTYATSINYGQPAGTYTGTITYTATPTYGSSVSVP